MPHYCPDLGPCHLLHRPSLSGNASCRTLCHHSLWSPYYQFYFSLREICSCLIPSPTPTLKSASAFHFTYVQVLDLILCYLQNLASPIFPTSILSTALLSQNITFFHPLECYYFTATTPNGISCFHPTSSKLLLKTHS